MIRNNLNDGLFGPLINSKVHQQDIGEVHLSSKDIDKLKSYTLQAYMNDVEKKGLATTWLCICKYVLEFGEKGCLLQIDNFGELYEIGLSIRDKKNKKENGQYYTPDDVATVMSRWLDGLEGENICDVACGTGKLILSYLEHIGKARALELLHEGKVFLYDVDEVALTICKTSILLRYGRDLEKHLNVICGDFLSRYILLPEHCRVISNPPYALIKQMGENWQETEVLNKSQELYAVFMEKIMKRCSSAVIISPYSFIAGTRFFPLRKLLNEYEGEIYSFDNVPGNIFCGRKHGIFNTNTSNSVRAAITVVRKGSNEGFRLTPMIRFKSSERKSLLTNECLERFLPNVRQKISCEHPVYYKCFKELQPLYDVLVKISSAHILSELVSARGDYVLSMPNTCRYFTSAFVGLLNRSGQTVLRFNDEKQFHYVFCLLNSSFAYWHWRLFDGGITYSSSLLMRLPVLFHCLNENDHIFFKEMFCEMSQRANEFIIKKRNVGIQENIKYPKTYRDAINQKMLGILDLKMDNHIFDIVHSNSIHNE